MRVFFVAALAVLCGGAGFLAGRQMPARHYVPYKGTLLLDTTSGKVCDTLRPEEEQPSFRFGFPVC